MSPLKTLAERLTDWLRTRAAIRELSQLTDRELNDIGLERTDIASVAFAASKAA